MHPQRRRLPTPDRARRGPVPAVARTLLADITRRDPAAADVARLAALVGLTR
ncbi:hypothetical protein [Micromonospora sp. RP3T]|uniref:hypothetical protein n=1 Tax=Micromonospora sp. RP3T TaxID=2135446 RepID=UPI001E57AB6B|nr:hypothetical protein [Micromonospora sp. RP3T]